MRDLTPVFASIDMKKKGDIFPFEAPLKCEYVWITVVDAATRGKSNFTNRTFRYGNADMSEYTCVTGIGLRGAPELHFGSTMAKTRIGYISPMDNNVVAEIVYWIKEV